MRTVFCCFLRQVYWPHLLLAAFLILLSGEIVSYRNLAPADCARLMERYAVLSGIVLFAPLSIPEQDRDFLSLVRSKSIAIGRRMLLRLGAALAAQAVVILTFLAALALGGSSFSALSLGAGAFAESCLLGAVAFAVGAISGNVLCGYLVGSMFYFLNLGTAARRFGALSLTQLQRGTNTAFPVMAGVILLLCAVGIYALSVKRC